MDNGRWKIVTIDLFADREIENGIGQSALALSAEIAETASLSSE